jgi:methyl-accepting chemotaxis protein
VSVVVLIILLICVYVITNRLVTARLDRLSRLLLAFFKYINHEEKRAPNTIPPTSNDEIGVMATAINSIS